MIRSASVTTIFSVVMIVMTSAGCSIGSWERPVTALPGACSSYSVGATYNAPNRSATMTIFTPNGWFAAVAFEKSDSGGRILLAQRHKNEQITGGWVAPSPGGCLRGHLELTIDSECINYHLGEGICQE